MSVPLLTGSVSLVSGASSGIGKGIAIQLGKAGSKVYITGRNKERINETCSLISDLGGRPIPVPMDHSDDRQVKELFERISMEQKGRLDVCVNNAYSGAEHILDNVDKPFWEMEPGESWDIMNGVGLRNHYLCTAYAARLMTSRGSGLIVNVSSGAGLFYLFNPIYGLGKAACDRMASDCALEMRKRNVAMVSIWPGVVKTELSRKRMEEGKMDPKSRRMFDDGQSTEFPGMAVVHLASDPRIMRKTGRTLMVTDLAREYGFRDLDGQIHGDIRSLKKVLQYEGWDRLASLVPEFIRTPKILIHIAAYLGFNP